MLKVHMVNIKTADQIALATTLHVQRIYALTLLPDSASDACAVGMSHR
jgi:hypothetical protein